MKPIFFLSILFFFVQIQSRAQLVSYTPLNADFEPTITLQFNLNFAEGDKAKNLLGKTDGLYLWAGAGSDVGNAFAYTPKSQVSFQAKVEGGKLTSLGGNRWEISLNPRIYFGVPLNTKIAVLGLIIKNEDGSAQTEDIVLKPGIKNELQSVVLTSKKTIYRTRD